MSYKEGIKSREVSLRHPNNPIVYFDLQIGEVLGKDVKLSNKYEEKLVIQLGGLLLSYFNMLFR